jgi:filamentous hemagglutinin family protein
MKFHLLLWISCLPLFLFPISAVEGQLKPDNTLGGENSVIAPIDKNNDRIDGGAKRGANLFHSFREFNVEEGRGVYFANPSGIDNILTRVTGGNASNIFGKLGVLGNANLFLINPNGIFFGKNASLDIRGSFFATTSEAIKLGENGVFSATDPQNNQLLNIKPEALFNNALRDRQAEINNEGNLAVGSGQNLTLLGGDITNTGSLSAPAGTIKLLGDRIGILDGANINVSGATGGGTVFIGGAFQGNGTEINALRTYIAPDVKINADALDSGNGGTVIVWADEVTGFYGNITAKGIDAGGFVEVSGKENLIFRGKVDTSAASGISGTLLLDPTDITIASGSGDSASDGTDTFAGNNSNLAGAILSSPLSEIEDTAPTTIYESELEELSGYNNILLQATNNIVVEDLADNVLNFAPGSGEIIFTADADGDNVGSFVMGVDLIDTLQTNGRNLKISGANLEINKIDTSVSADGNGGKIDLSASGSIKTNALNSSANNNSGNGGSITLNAGDSLKTASIDSSAKGAGDGGAISLSAATNIDTTAGLFITSSAFSGNAGNITLNAGTDIDTGRIIADSAGEGSGGKISVNAGSKITTSSIVSNANGGGDGGEIALDAGGELVTGAIDSSNFGEGSGGSVSMRSGSSISTESIDSSTSLNGDGGAINLSAGGGITNSVDEDRAFLNSRSDNQGNGGEITIAAGDDVILTTLDNQNTTKNFFLLDASAKEGNAGNVTIETDGNLIIGNVESIEPSNANGEGIAIAGIDSSSDGNGNGGSIALQADKDITIGDSDNPAFLNSFGGLNAGKITISSQTGNVTISNGLLESSLIGTNELNGNAGDLEIQAAGNISLNNTELRTTAFSPGNAGNISIVTPGNINLDKSRIFSSLEIGAKGTGGNIEIAGNNVSLTQYSFIDTATFGQGNAGDVSIETTNSLSLDNSSIFSITGGRGNAGNVKVNAGNSVDLANRSSISTAVNSTAEGNGGNLAIDTASVSVTGGSQLQALTRGNGTAGDITVNATDSITLSGIGADGFLSGIFTASEAISQGTGGNILVNTAGSLKITDRAVLNAQTSSNFSGGNITVSANTLELSQGGQLLTNTSNLGNAGNISVAANEGIIITGADPNFNDRVAPPQIRSIPVTDPVTIPEDLAKSQFLDLLLSLDPPDNLNADVEFSNRIPHVSISGNVSDSDAIDTYSFKVETAGTRGIFDIDTQPATKLQGVIGKVILLDSQGNELASNDIAPASVGAEGSKTANTNFSEDPYLRYVFTQPGTYFLQVEKKLVLPPQPGSSPIPPEFFASSYKLQVSLDIPNIAGTVAPALVNTKGDRSGLFAQTEGAGKAGNIEINSPQLKISQGASISAFTTNSGAGGNIAIDAPNWVTFDGDSQLSVETTASGNAGNLNITTNQLAISDRVKISASTSASGDGGNINLQVPEAITLNGESKLSVETTGSGSAGKIALTTENLTLAEGAQVTSSTSGAGDAGDVKLNVTNDIAISGAGSGIFANTAEASSGKGGNIDIDPKNISIEDGATISVDSQGSGDAGNIAITGNFLTLAEDASISARSFSTQGGNINLKDIDLLVLEDNSKITATAGIAKQDGDGGNISIDANFIFNLSTKDNPEITAEAFQGNGGNIAITSNAIFSRGLLEISASSKLGIDGLVVFNIPDTDPTSGLITLPSNPVDSEALLSQNFCKLSAGSSFVITGKGGIAPSPIEPLSNISGIVEWIDPDSYQNSFGSQASGRKNPELDRSSDFPTPIEQAQGWVKAADGTIVLTAQAPKVTLQDPNFGFLSCGQ